MPKAVGDWSQIIALCADKNLKFLPGKNSEPWLSYAAIAACLQIEERTVQMAATKHKIPRHPVFAGLIKVSDFETAVDETSQVTSAKRGDQ